MRPRGFVERIKGPSAARRSALAGESRTGSARAALTQKSTDASAPKRPGRPAARRSALAGESRTGSARAALTQKSTDASAPKRPGRPAARRSALAGESRTGSARAALTQKSTDASAPKRQDGPPQGGAPSQVRAARAPPVREPHGLRPCGVNPEVDRRFGTEAPRTARRKAERPLAGESRTGSARAALTQK